MNHGSLRIVALGCSISLLLSACEDLTPGQNAAAFGTGAGLLAAGIASAAGANTFESLAIGAVVGGVVGMSAYVISKHQATERQRRVAEQRARVYYAHLAPSRKVALKKNRVRYLAVDTDRSKQAPPEAKKSVMIWDTQSETVVGHDVYDVKTTPAVGATGKFDRYPAYYAGSGR
ncbi:MAG: hypothetical protein WDN28_23000 [Chthoniobacter sp.]